MAELQNRILTELINKYEKSKSFIGQNKVEQRFSLNIAKTFPKYLDKRDYEYFEKLNNALFDLEKHGFVNLQKDGISIVKVTLILTEKNIETTYKLLHREPKRQIQNAILEILQKNIEQTKSIEFKNYLQKQICRIEENKKVDFFDNDIDSYEDILKAVEAVLQNEDEIFIRDFSLKVFGNSKRFEQIQNSINSILVAMFENLEKETCLLEFNIVKTPTYVCVKGNAIIYFENQQINLSLLKSDIAFSTKTLSEIVKIKVLGQRVVTIENLTSFHDYSNREDFVIYLAGFHNQVKETFLKKVYQDNQHCEYKHFGDIDAGGFYIFENLKNKTQIPFSSFLMDLETLQKYHNEQKTIQLTKNDRLRLEKFIKNISSNDENFLQYSKLINYMLENDCKLEQENVKIEKIF